MDNERQMSSILTTEANLILAEKAKRWFLSVAEDFRTAQEKYDLEREFAATKKNRRPWVFLTVLATCVVFVGLAWGLVSTYERTNNTIQISSREFDDIAQRDLLDSAKNIEAERDFVTTTLAQLETDRQSALDKTKSDFEDQMVLARTMNLKAEALEKRKVDSEAKRDRAVAQVNARFEKDAAPVRTSLAEIEGRLAQFNPAQLESARKQEVILNSERKVYDLEKAQFRDAYEAQIKRLIADNSQRIQQKDLFIGSLEKQAHDTLVAEQIRLTKLYNPTFDSGPAVNLLSREVDETRLATPGAHVPQVYLESAILKADNVDQLNRRIVELKGLLSLMENTPYINSVPGVIRQVYARALELVDLNVSYFDPFYQVIQQKSAIIAERDKTIESLNSLNARNQFFLGVETDILGKGWEANSVSAKQESLIIGRGTGGTLVAYVRPQAEWPQDQRVYVVQGGTEVLGEFEVSGDGILRTLQYVGTADNSPAVASIKANDWVVRKDAYVKSAAYPKAPAR